MGEPVPDRRLRELDFGSLEGSRWEEWPAEVRGELSAFDGFCAPGGESVGELRRRVLEFVGALRDGEHLAFTHGWVIRLLLRMEGRDRQVLPGELVQVFREIPWRARRLAWTTSSLGLQPAWPRS